jgi:hypothetical protein
VHRSLPLLLALLLSTLLVAPAAAGTAADPELVDDCGLEANLEDGSVVPAEVDLCAGWLTTSVDGDVTSLTASLLVDGDAEAASGGQYRVGWAVGECTYGLTRDEQADRTTFETSCGAPREVPCPLPVDSGCTEPAEVVAVPLPATAFAEDGSTLTWTVRFDGALAGAADAHRPGTVLGSINAITVMHVGPQPFGAFLCSTGGIPDDCATYGVDAGRATRDHVVGG